MATTLPRHMVTELPEVRQALDVARTVWPHEKSTTRLIYNLLTEGARHLTEDPGVKTASRKAALRNIARRHPFPHRDGQAYLRRLRDEEDA